MIPSARYRYDRPETNTNYYYYYYYYCVYIYILYRDKNVHMYNLKNALSFTRKIDRKEVTAGA